MPFSQDWEKGIRDEGRQVLVTVGGVTTVYLGDTYEWTSARNTKYYFAGGQRVALRRTGYAANNGLSWLFSDHDLAAQDSGSTSLRVAGSGGSRLAELRFKAWGETRYTYGSLRTKFQFTGQRNETADIGLYFYNARWYDPALGRFAQADTVVPGVGNSTALDRYAYANNNPLYYTDPTGHMAIGDSNNEAGCTTPGSTKCILDKYYGVSTANEWMMDMELYYYQQAYPEYEVNSDPYLDNIGKLIVTTPSLRADCAEGSFWSCFAMAVMGGIGTTFAQPVIIRPAESAPQKYGVYADPDCPGCGYTMSVPRLPEALSGDSAETYVYIGYRDGEPVYVGITNNPATRQSAHGDRFTIVPINTTPVTRGQARAIEQGLIVQNPQFENIYSSISPNHSYYQDAFDWGNWWLAQSGRNP